MCPTAALKWHATSGAVELITEKCTACDKCVDVCPTHVIVRSDTGIRFDGAELPWYPIICDLCGGDPACTRICPTGAIYTDERKVIR